MKKKLVRHASIFLLICFATVLTACGRVSENTNCIHKWSDWTIEANATCGEEGSEVRTCSECGESENRSIPKTEHTGEIVWVKDSKAHNEAYSCCGTIVSSEAHDWNGSMCLICGFQPTVSISEAKYYVGEESITLNVVISDNPGLVGLSVCVQFDDSVLTLTHVENGYVLGDLSFTQPGELVSGSNFLWDGMESSVENAKNGSILTLTFTVSQNANLGLYPITLTVRGYDNDLQPIEFNAVNGSITVKR